MWSAAICAVIQAAANCEGVTLVYDEGLAIAGDYTMQDFFGKIIGTFIIVAPIGLVGWAIIS